jgi:ABC-type lipoprotein release transport system permease subunit
VNNSRGRQTVASLALALATIAAPPFDVGTFAVIGFVLAGVAARASYLPARRTARLDPFAAWRME